MKPVDMIVKHDPDNGSYGDCLRACVASILEERCENVPHFYEPERTHQAAMDNLFAYLRPQGMYPLCLILHKDVVEGWCDFFRGYYILGGTTTRGTKHWVVAQGRLNLVHDPHPTDKSGVFADTHGEIKDHYVVILFVRLL